MTSTATAPAMAREPIVVILNQDGAATIAACLRAVRDLVGDPNQRIVVVDCGSKDASQRAVLTCGVDAEWLPLDSRNLAECFNHVAQSTDRDILCLRSDVLPNTPDFGVRLAQRAAEQPELGVLGGQLLHFDGRIRSAGRNPIGGGGVANRHANRQQFSEHKAGSGLVSVDSVANGLTYFTRAAIESVGGLDPQLGFGMGDDDDFCFAARRAGFGVAIDKGITATQLSCEWSPTTHLSHTALGKKIAVLENTEAAIRRAQAPWLQAKWGFDPRYPDLSEIRRLYGSTPVCWRIGEPMRWRPSSPQPPVDIAIVTWNNCELFERCLESLATTDYPSFRVVVTDNGSTDGTLEMLERMRSTVPFPLEVHPLPVNTGAAIGFNWSMAHGSAELVARVDDDVILPSDWLTRLVETMHRRPYAGCVGPKILNDDARRTIQCGPSRMFPYMHAHCDEEDRGQADFIARTVHVRGCCNLYRRDVLDVCGMFDLRYSPSQWDDPDHHVKLAVAGYEILYDGRVGVVHALTTGKGRTWAAMTNQNANQGKLTGKWGKDIWRILDSTLDLAVGGRVLPDDDTAFARSLPAPDTYPRRPEVPAPSGDLAATKLVQFRATALDTSGPLREEWEDLLRGARYVRRDGNPRAAAGLLQSMLDLIPAWPRALAELANCYADLAQPEETLRYAELVARLATDPDATAMARAAVARSGADGARDHQRTRVGEAAPETDTADGPTVPAQGRRTLRVLMVNTFLERCAGGDSHQVRKTKQALERCGVEVDIACTPHPDPTGYDLVHVFNLWFPVQTLPQVRGIRRARPDIPIVCTPIYWTIKEKNWAERAIPLLYDKANNLDELEHYLSQLADGRLELNGLARNDANEDVFPGYSDYQREILESMDHLLPQSHRESQLIQRQFGLELPSTVVRNAAEPALFESADPNSFRRETGLTDFVLTVGLLEVRKNQLLLLQALRDTGLPVVVVGRSYNTEYEAMCREVAGPNAVFIENMPHERLASAMRAARVFALPSWMECAAFASLEAAATGCPLVVGNRTSEREYFGDAAYYADPADVRSIRSAVVRAWQERDDPAAIQRRATLQARCANEFHWDQVAEQTLRGYRAALTARVERVRTRAAELVGVE